MEWNAVLDKLPNHLRNIIIDQPYNEYTAQDHAVWRFIMRRNVEYLSKVAHESYLGGLKKTGISIDHIPHMYGMNRILKEIGWAAVAVDGFIPPAAFMEFQAYNVLVIAADIRPIDQILYTPAPDIVHEAAGHAPIIADPEYAEYLREFGRIGAKAFSSAVDYQQYEAIRHLSILKADPYTPSGEIEKAEQELDEIERKMHAQSEMSRIRNLHWWTVEYGLIGALEAPKIYGAGLLSSIGESYSALQNTVKKLPYGAEAANMPFDITTRQPQLYVTPDFRHLTEVLNQFADQMALRKGGTYALRQAVESENLSTCVWSSGLQASGLLKDFDEFDDSPAYLSFSGPVALSFNDKQLENHGKEYHTKGFGSPVGMWRNCTKKPELMHTSDLEGLGIIEGERCKIQYESGVFVKGTLRKILFKNGRLLILSFSDCTVKWQGQTLFQPDWGMYDMAVGAGIVSAFSGLADTEKWGFSFPVPKEKTHKIEHSSQAKSLHAIYQKIREMREQKVAYKPESLWQELKSKHPEDWLAPLEILEYLHTNNSKNGLSSEIETYLLMKKSENKELNELIRNGMNFLNH